MLLNGSKGTLVAGSPDGLRVVTRGEFSNKSRLRAYTLDDATGKTATLNAEWTPYQEDRSTQVDWAGFSANDRFLTRSLCRLRHHCNLQHLRNHLIKHQQEEMELRRICRNRHYPMFVFASFAAALCRIQLSFCVLQVISIEQYLLCSDSAKNKSITRQ